MDVGAANFRFDLDTKNGLTSSVQTVRAPRTTEVHLDSLDRYLPNMLTANSLLAPYSNSQTVAKLAGPFYLPSNISGTVMNINNGRPIVFGYFGRVAITQFMLKRDIPTIRLGANDVFSVAVASSPAGPVTASYNITIPPGYYTNAQLAITLQTQLVNAGITTAFVLAPFATGNDNNSGFLIGTGNPAVYMAVILATGLTETVMTQRLNCFRTLGFNRAILGYPNINTSAALPASPTYYLQAAGSAPNLLSTDYIDIVSQSLTNYKDAKDANSSLDSPGAVLARVWLIESATNVSNSPAYLTNIGSAPFAVVKTWVNPNWCQWSPNQTLNTVDIKLINMHGNELNWTSGTPTEWSATLTFTE
jgi:hypothetical protein